MERGKAYKHPLTHAEVNCLLRSSQSSLASCAWWVRGRPENHVVLDVRRSTSASDRLHSGYPAGENRNEP